MNMDVDSGTPGAMECSNCEQMQRRFFCETCLRGHIRTHNQKNKVLSDARDKLVTAAAQALGPLEEKRIRRATIAELERKLTRHRNVGKRLTADIQAAKEDIQKRRAILIERREALAQAYAQFPYLTQTTSSTATLTPSTVNAKDSPVSRYPAHPNPIDGIHASMSALRTQHNQLTREITEARQMLIQELVDVFQIVEVGGRPALDVGNGAFGSMIGGGRGGDGPGARGKRGEWEIAGRLMCVPGDVGRFPPLHINAAITHTLHFLTLLTFYLGIKLPFEVDWSTLQDGGKAMPTFAEDDSGSLTPTRGGAKSASAASPSSSGFRYGYGNLSVEGASLGGGLSSASGKRGVGTPWIRAGKGGESGGWARWTRKNPLHIPTASSFSQTPSQGSQKTNSSSTKASATGAIVSTPSQSASPPAQLDSPTTISPLRSRTASTSSTHRVVSAPTTPITPSSGSKFGLGFGLLRPYLDMVSGKHEQPSSATRRRTLSNSSAAGDADLDGASTRTGGKKSRSREEPAASFTTGFAMLLYNVAYLAHTQAVDIPLAQTGEVLRNLWAVCCSAELGRRSHETHPPLPAPTPPTFHLEFSQLLQATAVDPASRAKARRRISSDTSDSVAAAASGSAISQLGHRAGRKRVGREGVIVEEDEWDLVEDAL